MLYVKTNSPLEALGLASMFEADSCEEDGSTNAFDNELWRFIGNFDTCVGVLIDPEKRLISYMPLARVGELTCGQCNASIGWNIIALTLKAQLTPDVKVGDTVVFCYDGLLDAKRVVIVKEVDSKHVKGLDVLNDFAFKSFLRNKIANLKQVKS